MKITVTIEMEPQSSSGSTITPEDLEERHGPKRGRKTTGKAMSNNERQAKWRAANRDIALQRQRDAMKKIREQKKRAKERWKAKNREHYLEKNREYVRRSREKKSNNSR